MKQHLHFTYITMDGGHNAALREAARLLFEETGIRLDVALHSMASLRNADDWALLERDLQRADVIFGCMIFGEEHVRPLEALVDDLETPMCFITSNPALIYKTQLGGFSLNDPAEGDSVVGKWMQKLRPKKKGKSESHRQTEFIENLTKLMKHVPRRWRGLHTFIVSHEYWIHSSPENLKRMMVMYIERYVPGYEGELEVEDAIKYPESAIYHPDAPEPFPDVADYQAWQAARGRGESAGAVGLLTQRAIILSGNTAHLDTLIRNMEAQGLEVRTAYSTMLDFRPAITSYFTNSDLPHVDLMMNGMGFPLVGGPAGSRPDEAVAALHQADVAYFDMIPLGFQRVEDWHASDMGLNPMQVAMNIALPELDGSAEPVIFGGPTMAGDKFIALDDELNLAGRRVARRVRLARKANADKKVAVVLFNFPPNLGNTGTAAFLDVFESLYTLLGELKADGYAVEVPESVEALRDVVTEGNAATFGTPANVGERLSVDAYRTLFPWYTEIEEYWGYAPGDQLTDGRDFYIMGAHFGNVFVAVQPGFGYERDPMRLLMGKNASPHHGFAAFYTWLNHAYDADAVVHFGTHGALEFMPGKQAGVSANCWPTRLLGELPNFYYYCVNNPSEGSIAKRRSAATLVSYMVPPLQQAGLYKGLRRLKDDIDTYQKHTDERLLADIRTQADKLGITVEATNGTYIPALRHELVQVEHRMIPLGLHVLGTTPAEDELVDMLALVVTFNSVGDLPTLPVLVAQGRGWDYAALNKAMKTDATAQDRYETVDTVVRDAIRAFVRGDDPDAVLGVDADLSALWAWLGDLLFRIQHDEEIDGLLHALEGGYVRPSPGNDVMRNTAIVPTGRNIHALDPYRVPSELATRNAGEIVEAMLAKVVREQGQLPETVAMVLWGTDNLKSDGEGIAQCLHLIGAEALEDELGNITDVRLIALEKLGRPRIDVVMTVSGIFRDVFHHQAGLLDKAIRLAAEANEPFDMNYIRKHTMNHSVMLGVDVQEAAARVFSNAAGTYGANVNYLVESSAWDSDDELADMFMTRKSYAYQPGGDWHAARDVMERALGTVDAAFQNIDSFEMGISDIDHYYEYLGGITKSVEKLKGERPSVMVADALGLEDRLSSLEGMVRLESRAKLLNPKWYEAMLKHGYEGVKEIETRVTNTTGWSATTDAVEGWVYDDISATFMLDEAMRQRLAAANPHATAAIARRLLEADARGFWAADDETIETLRGIYANLEDQLEGIG